MTHDAFRDLPLFATDLEIATAIVGKARAAKWVKDTFPTLAARPGFPRVDAFHGGRAVPLVRLFYEAYLGLMGAHPGWAQDGEENFGSWKKIREDKKVRAKANGDAWAERKRNALEAFRAKRTEPPKSEG